MKLFTKIFATSLLLISVVGTAACGKKEHKHVVNEAEWETSETMHWHACEGCDKHFDEGYHTFPSEWTVTKEATCKEAGEKVKRCTVCNYEIKEIIEKLTEHTWGEWEVTKQPTINEKGVETRTCSVCGETETREIEKRTEHEFGEWEVTTPATCTEKGVETRTCKYCGEKETREIDALGHNFGAYEITTPATCTEKGVETRTCSVCGVTETREIPALGHEYKDYKFNPEPTLEAKGKIEISCTRCEDLEIVELPALSDSLYIKMFTGNCLSGGHPIYSFNNPNELAKLFVGTMLEGNDYVINEISNKEFNVTREGTGSHETTIVRPWTSATPNSTGEVKVECTTCHTSIKVKIPRLNYDDYNVTILNDHDAKYILKESVVDTLNINFGEYCKTDEFKKAFVKQTETTNAILILDIERGSDIVKDSIFSFKLRYQGVDGNEGIYRTIENMPAIDSKEANGYYRLGILEALSCNRVIQKVRMTEVGIAALNLGSYLPDHINANDYFADRAVAYLSPSDGNVVEQNRSNHTLTITKFEIIDGTINTVIYCPTCNQQWKYFGLNYSKLFPGGIFSSDEYVKAVYAQPNCKFKEKEKTVLKTAIEKYKQENPNNFVI